VSDRLATFFAGPVMTFAGVLHFVKPHWYEWIMPRYVPAHRELVYASGVAEILGALGTMHPRTRRPAGAFLIATLVAVFPANVHMAVNAGDFKDVPGGAAALWARLPFQALFVYWVWRATQRRD
jgi:uncharacterized membrane protein